MADVRVALIGVGNVGSTFAQGLDYYGNGTNSIGLWHQKVAGLKPSNIKIVAAYDINPDKVGKNISDVVWQGSAIKSGHVDSKIIVDPGILSDETGKYQNQPQFLQRNLPKSSKILGPRLRLTSYHQALTRRQLTMRKLP